MPPRRRKRLDPVVFGLPIDQIKQGFFTDVYFDRARAVLRRFSATPDLPHLARAVLQRRQTVIDAQLDIERAKQQLVAGDYLAARRHLVAGARGSMKARLANVALNVAPRLLRRAYLAWRGWVVTDSNGLAVGERLDLSEPPEPRDEP